MHKDSLGHVGFFIKKGKVVSVVKGSSAARNGLLTNHYVCEVNGQNVIGLKVRGLGWEGRCLTGHSAPWVQLPPPKVSGISKSMCPELCRHRASAQ